jgi:hypothetical protein
MTEFIAHEKRDTELEMFERGGSCEADAK